MLANMKQVVEKCLRVKKNHVEVVVRKDGNIIRYYQIAQPDGEPGAICALIQPGKLIIDKDDVLQLFRLLDYNDIADNNIYVGMYDKETNQMKFWKITHLMEYIGKQSV